MCKRFNEDAMAIYGLIVMFGWMILFTYIMDEFQLLDMYDFFKEEVPILWIPELFTLLIIGNLYIWPIMMLSILPIAIQERINIFGDFIESKPGEPSLVVTIIFSPLIVISFVYLMVTFQIVYLVGAVFLIAIVVMLIKQLKLEMKYSRPLKSFNHPKPEPDILSPKPPVCMEKLEPPKKVQPIPTPRMSKRLASATDDWYMQPNPFFVAGRDRDIQFIPYPVELYKVRLMEVEKNYYMVIHLNEQIH